MTGDRPSGGPVADHGALRAAALLKTSVRPERRLLALAAGVALGNAGLLLWQYRLLASAVAAVLFDGADLATVWPGLWPILPIIGLRAALVWAGNAASTIAAARVKQSLRMAFVQHLCQLGPVSLREERAGALAALVVEGIEALEPYYARFLPAMANAGLLPLAVLAAVFPADWLSGVVLFLTAPLIPLAMILIGRGAERLNQRQWASLARMGAHFLEAFQNLTTLKLFNASRREAQLIARMSDDYRLAVMTVLRVAFLSALALEFFATLGVALVAVLIGFRLLDGAMGFERAFFVLLVAPEFYLPLRSMGVHYHARMEAIGAATGLADLLSRPVPLSVSSRTGPPATDGAGLARTASGELDPSAHGRDARPTDFSPSLPPRIRFEGVHLAYPDGRKGLNGADFDLEPGRFTALVGPSGAGKSSLVSVLLGFAAVARGEVLVDGAPLAGMDPDEWRRRIAWVPQAPHLFAGTVADNIRLGAPRASDEAVERASRLIGADDFIRALPGAYGYRIGEGGSGLSGGQRRLIALARAALLDRPLLILDEPTASLDRRAEDMAGRAIHTLAQGRSLLVIAHRLETVRAADLILVMDGGRVVERGAHAALMAADGLYAALVKSGDAFVGAAS